MTVLSAWLEQILWPYLVDLQSSIRLIINADKTHLLVLGTNASVGRRSMVSMQTNEYSIRPSNQEKLLGCIVSDKLKWRQHILENELSRRVNGLSIITSKADFTNDFGKWFSDI